MRKFILLSLAIFLVLASLNFVLVNAQNDLIKPCCDLPEIRLYLEIDGNCGAKNSLLNAVKDNKGILKREGDCIWVMREGSIDNVLGIDLKDGTATVKIESSVTQEALGQGTILLCENKKLVGTITGNVYCEDDKQCRGCNSAIFMISSGTPKICNDNIDNNGNGKIDCDDEECNGRACMQPGKLDGVCSNKLCVRTNYVEMTIDPDYLNHLPVDKFNYVINDPRTHYTYLKEENIPKTSDEGVLVVRPDDKIICRGDFVAYSTANKELSDAEIDVVFEVSDSGEESSKQEAKCIPFKKINVGNKFKYFYTCHSPPLQKVFSVGVPYSCYTYVKGDSRGTASDKIVVGKYFYYFVKVNQDDWGDSLQEWNKFVSLSEINKNYGSAAKAIFISPPVIVEKEDYLNQGKSSCNLNENINQAVIKQLSDKITSDDNNRLIIVSKKIMKEYVQCQHSLKQTLVDLTTSAYPNQLMLIPRTALLPAAPFTKLKTDDEIRKWEDGLTYGIKFLPNQLCVLIGYAEDVPIAGHAGLFLEATHDAVYALGQGIRLSETEHSLDIKNYVIIGGSNVNALTKSLAKIYDPKLCYEQNIMVYEKSKIDNSNICTNKWSVCCVEGITEQYIDDLKSLTLGALPFVGGVIDRYELGITKGSCGSPYDCPGKPKNYIATNKNPDVNPPKSAMGNLKEEIYIPSDKGVL